jgi:DNA-binding NtrC family response regulator
VLLKTLAFHNNDKSATARTLGVSVRTIHNQLARLRHAANA